ncbi:MAG: hypothetical protein EGR71_04135 [Clostridiales bacterium]|nr:hypothetical protein [Clostridiales bacterium]
MLMRLFFTQLFVSERKQIVMMAEEKSPTRIALRLLVINRSEMRNFMDKIKAFKTENILTALLYVALGLLLMIFPESIAKTLCYTIATLLIVVGLIRIIGYFLKKEQDGYSRTGIVSGLIFVILGIFITVSSRAIISVIPFIMGICILISGFSKLQYVFQLNKYMNEKNKGMFLVAIVTIIVGVVLVFNPFRAAKWMIRLVGICIAFTGASDLITGIYFYRKMRDYIKDMQALEQDYVEK